MDNKPSVLLLRITRIEAGEPRGSITLDNSADPKSQRELIQNMRNIAEGMIAVHGIKKPGKHDLIEVISGQTANKIERIEDLLNDARNLLIDLAADEPEDGETRAQIERMLDDMTTELGYD
jgi:hypothetical protein